MAVFAIYATDARAQLFKCVGKDGKVAYQGEPCPPSVDEQRVRAPAPGDPPAAPPATAPAAAASGASKEGWTPAQSSAIKNDCSKDAFAGAQKGWGGDPAQFPEGPMRDAVDKYCDCLVGRITGTLTPAKYLQNRFDAVARVTGECKMEIPAK